MTETEHRIRISEALLKLRTGCRNGSSALNTDAAYTRLSDALESALHDGYALKGIKLDDWGFEKAVLTEIPINN